MRIIGVDSALLGVEDIGAAKRFYRDFGLAEDEPGETGTTFLTCDGSEIALRGNLDLGLPPAVTGGSTIREMVWGVADAQELEKIGAELSRDREVRAGNDGTLHSFDDDGFAIGFRRSRRRSFAPGADTLNIFGASPRRGPDIRVDFDAPIAPATIAHVVLYSPDIPRAMRFYVDRLKFRVSDIFEGENGVFLRAAGSSDHHTLFLIRHRDRIKGLHHLAFHLTDFNEVMMGGTRLAKKGWETAVGPGRHIVGSNYFWYFKSPCGGAMEYSADMDRATDDWQPQKWPFGPQTFYAWALTYDPAPTPISGHR